MRIFIALFLLAGAAGCAGGMSKDECLYADWRAIGYEDGANGYSAAAISHKRQACANKAGVTPDMQAYLEGRESGLKEFCRPANGFSVGARGVGYRGVCAGHDEADFVAAHGKGRELYLLSSAASEAGRALRQAEGRLDSIIDRIAYVEAALVSPETPHLERIDYLVERRQLADERQRVEQDLVVLADEYDAASADAAAYRDYLAAQGAYPGAVTPTSAAY